ncbi:hypothetical protein GLOTRDRAFT_125497 [Gloeophyllum trabeum ATCC 11539]|uniref:Uncharacterized protein n=1 Tax=Gloeophyllum trabeum (strain ATCC 11539 / FP-39264 / Madison 617) TaxID=670483 RepID=S7QIN3_GLOTA|nr:uncharacterized protein GLOTRDRAFT_125497 [Gloeophyllum trabeum ATCC 11539]EPQ59188.1 hypothetical protein GLOTRDRAFT_125497 [Gloeophyllum trabeum ATCC 11539]
MVSCTTRPRWRISPLILFGFACLTLVSGGINYTIDDQYGDPFNGFYPLYTSTPEGRWSLGPECSRCDSKPQIAFAHDGTWHDSTFNNDTIQVGLDIPFNGTAIYVYCIMDNTNGDYTRFTNLSFALDNQPVGSYSHIPNYALLPFQYNVLVYGNDKLENGAHNLTVIVGGSGNSSLILFDYAVYTYEGEAAGGTSTSTPPPSASTTASIAITKPSSNDAVIIGSVLGGVLLLSATAMVVYMWHLKQSIRPASSMWRFSFVKPRHSRGHDGFSMSESRLNAGKTPYSNPFWGGAKRPWKK